MTEASARRRIADLMDGYDGEIAAIQESKREAWQDYRDRLEQDGMRKHDIKLEVEGCKRAIVRRRKLLAQPAEVEALDDAVQEILDDLMAKRAGTKNASHTRAAHEPKVSVPVLDDLASDEVVALAEAPAAAPPNTAPDASVSAASSTEMALQSTTSAPSAHTFPSGVPQSGPIAMGDLPPHLDRRSEAPAWLGGAETAGSA